MDRSLGRHVALTLRAAGLRVELHDDHFPDDTADADWLAKVAAKNWVVLTKDKAIRRNRWERLVVMESNVRMFTLSSGKMTGQEMADTFLTNRLRMARLLKKHAAPFVAVVHKNGVELVAP